MRKIIFLSILLMIPILAFSQTPPTISKVEIVGVPEQFLSADLRDSMQKLVGQRYEAATVDPIVRRIETEQPDFVVATRNLPDGEPGRIKLDFVLLLLSPKSPGAAGPDSNVNSQYIVESVEVKGLLRTDYSDALYDEMQSMTGRMLDNKKIEDLRARLLTEPKLKRKYFVSDKIERGTQPEHVKIVFEATKVPWAFRFTIGKAINISGSGGDDPKDTDIVESADVKGVPRSAISDTLYSAIQMMIGKRIDQVEADHLKEELESELKGRYSVAKNIRNGTRANTARIVYELKEIPWIPERTYPDVATYHPKQGISLFAEGNIYKALTLGMGTDGETLTERYKGFKVGLESQLLGSRHFGAKLRFDTFGVRWKSQTLQTLQSSPEIPSAYRTRQAIEPSMAFAFNRTLSATAGLSLVELEMMSPSLHWESAHEAVASLRYTSPTLKNGKGTYEFTSGYEVRTATRNLDSDFVYTRHLWDGSYSAKSGKTKYKVSYLAGKITGNPPLFGRFSLGNTETLRGWNKYDIDPIGGTRVYHMSTEWSHDDFGVFLDNGAIWSSGESLRNRTSVGVSLGPLKLAVPLRCSRNCGVTFLIHLD